MIRFGRLGMVLFRDFVRIISVKVSLCKPGTVVLREGAKYCDCQIHMLVRSP